LKTGHTERNQRTGRVVKNVRLEPLHLVTGRAAAVESLRCLVETGQLMLGDRLPTERELSQLLGISRTILREAVSVLEAQGLIRTRQGSGMYVTAEVSNNSLSSMWRTWYAAHRNELVHVLQVREALELKAVMLAASHSTRQLVVGLRANLREMKATHSKGDIQLAALLDARFHKTIVEASYNPILVQLLSSLDTVLENDRVAVFQFPEHIKDSLKDHMCIVDAIQKHDPAAAGGALTHHFERVIRKVEEGDGEAKR
jgi:DNA-binding FadR family transcriptional regulator